MFSARVCIKIILDTFWKNILKDIIFHFQAHGMFHSLPFIPTDKDDLRTLSYD